MESVSVMVPSKSAKKMYLGEDFMAGKFETVILKVFLKGRLSM